MIIRQGYWNYYIAFQLDSIHAVSKCMKQGKLERSVLAIIRDNQQYFRNPLMSKNQLEGINEYIDCNINLLKDTADNVRLNHGMHFQDKAMFALTTPIVMTTFQNKDIICPTMLYLISFGLGVVKVRIPLNNVDSKYFATMPTKKWYKSVKMPQYLSIDAGYIEAESSNINDITELLFGIVTTAFDTNLLSKDHICCFENITLLKTTDPTIEGQDFKDNKNKLIDLLYAKESGEQDFNVSGKEVSICGKSILSCRPGRVLTFGSIKTMKEFVKVEGIISDIDLLETCIQNSFDWTICLALWKKVNEITCLMTSSQKSADISNSIAKYNLIQHELDGMLDTSSYLLKEDDGNV